jgi:CheY-like chemotaxis protein
MNAIVNGDVCRSFRVLVVDDVVDAAAMLALGLRLEGFDASAATSAAEALAVASSTTFDALLLDISMPGMDGYALAKKLRGLYLDKPLLIAVTGYGKDQDRERSHRECFDYHFIKPADIEELATVLRQHANRIGRDPGALQKCP